MSKHKIEFKTIYQNKEEKLYDLFMWLIGILSNKEIIKLTKSLNEYVKGSEEK